MQQQHHVAADRGAFERFIPFDEETRLNRIRDGLTAIRDLCVHTPNGEANIRLDQLGYLIEMVVLDLGRVEIGARDGVIARLGDTP